MLFSKINNIVDYYSPVLHVKELPIFQTDYVEDNLCYFSNIFKLAILTTLVYTQVTHGNLKFDVGFVKYLPPETPLVLFIGPAVGAFLLLLIIILIIAIYRHIGERDRRIKRLEKQRDEMEMRVAQECKDGKYFNITI